jgi:hypothetical protein
MTDVGDGPHKGGVFMKSTTTTRFTLGALSLSVATLAIVCVTAGGRISAAGQQDGEGTRQIWNSDYGNKNAAGRRRARRKYKVATPAVPTDGVAADSVIGVTIWRLREVKPADSGARMLAHTDSGVAEFVPVRAEADSRFSLGERVRLSIEAARAGFLYVIDREQYADGKLGDSYLIFPTLRTRLGRNELASGGVVEIPDQADRPPYFTLTPGNGNEVAEVLTIIVSPKPLDGITIGRDPLALGPKLVDQWENTWGAAPGRLELEDGAGQGWTTAEKEAGSDSSRSLRQEDPGPQTLYYNPKVKPGMPVLVKLQLRYGSAGGSK